MPRKTIRLSDIQQEKRRNQWNRLHVPDYGSDWICPCGSTDLSVDYTRAKNNGIARVRKCEKCGKTCETFEQIKHWR